jgi:DNA-binding GntR family transcriptional regulator
VTEVLKASGPPDEGSPSLADDVYWTLRREIIHGALRPNVPLVEADIAEWLKVSRTPVRESMQRLAVDGLIISRRRRWFVYEHSRDEVVELYEIRAALEGYAARLACQRATDEQLDEISKCRTATISADGGQRERVMVNERFHDLVIAAANNRRLADLIERNRLFHFNYRIASLYTPADLEISSGQHLDLLRAVCARDAETAEQVTRHHIEHALKLILEKLY